jgi:hypothetical protein
VVYLCLCNLLNPRCTQCHAESKTIPTCTGYVCGDRKCVNATRCDGVAQCVDGSDELRCKRQSSRYRLSCLSSEFKCTTYYYTRGYQCIPSSYQCDGDSDCSDGSDERNCAIYYKLLATAAISLVACMIIL